jgi:AAA+ ATPase superfamily predicted ATPase
MAAPDHIPTYDWPIRGEFINRSADLGAMERWWDSSNRDVLALIGRRRVGKSWAFKAFAHDKRAIILTADRVVEGRQMTRFADQLEPLLGGVRPALADVGALVRTLYQLGRDEKLLAIIDEFPFLLPEGAARASVLTQLLAIMEEERERSKTKLVLCGSLIGQMESLLAQDSPLHGRLQRLDIWPLDFAEARFMMPSGDSPADRIERYAVAGGMAKYLSALSEDRPLADLVCDVALDRRGPLFDDPRSVLEQELRSPATYFSILEELSGHAAQMDHLTKTLNEKPSQITSYLDRLREMRLISAELPVGAPPTARSRRYSVDDGFIRFWFRFVFPHQENLQSGLRPVDLWNGDISQHLADFVAPAFERICAHWTRVTHGAQAQSVGGWWGNALNEHRRTGARTSEEIDIAGAYRKQLRIVGECKWTEEPMSPSVLQDLRTYKIPAVAQEGRLKIPAGGPQILLFSKNGFASALHDTAASDENIRLVTLDELVRDLDATHPE